jgi:hypothetical protein
MWLVVAMRLQAQQPSFRLCTSSNTASIPTNVAQGSSFTDFKREMRFPSCTFRLKKRLGELAQFKTRLQFRWGDQSELTCSLASHTRIEGHQKACLSLRRMSSWFEIALFRQERDMSPKWGRVSLSKSQFGITKWWESIWSSCAFRLDEGFGEFTRWFKS